MSPENVDRAAWLQGPPAECDPLPQQTENPYRLVLLGAPGVGKGTQAALLSRRLKACHLSTGDVFRAASQCQPSPAMQSALGYMRRGELVPDSIVWEMVRERRACLHCGGGFILDGFPRTLGQADLLQRLMASESIPLMAVVKYELPIAAIVTRLSGRRTCEKCKSVYHMTELPPKVAGVCDRCAGRLLQRDDDRPEAIKVRMQAYERSTAPLIEFYQNLGLLQPVTADGTPEEICTRTVSALTARRARGVSA